MNEARSNLIRILIADDHPIFRDGLSRLLDDDGGFQVVGQASDGNEAVRLTRDMPRASGLDALRELSRP